MAPAAPQPAVVVRAPMFCCRPGFQPIPVAPFGYGRPMMIGHPMFAAGGIRRR
jgi:hypothetical protein